MNEDTKGYKDFIDGLVNYVGSASYIKEQFVKGEWDFPASQKLKNLPSNVRKAVSEIMEEVVETAVHDVLVYLHDNDYAIACSHGSLPRMPFGQTLYEDYVSRVLNIPWPDSETN